MVGNGVGTYGGVGMGLIFTMVWEWDCYFEMELEVKAGNYGNGGCGIRLTVSGVARISRVVGPTRGVGAGGGTRSAEALRLLVLYFA